MIKARASGPAQLPTPNCPTLTRTVLTLPQQQNPTRPLIPHLRSASSSSSSASLPGARRARRCLLGRQLRCRLVRVAVLVTVGGLLLLLDAQQLTVIGDYHVQYGAQ